MSEDLRAKIEEYKAALVQDPKSSVFSGLCNAYLQLGQLDDALEVALKGSWESPQSTVGHLAVGRVYFEKKVLKKAEEAFFRALSIDQMCIPAYKGLARIYRNNGDHAKASDILTKAIMLDPGDASLQQMIESLSSPEVSTQSSPEAATEIATGNNVASQEPAMDQPSDGMKSITTATIADIYIEQGLYDKALEVYRELLTEKPNDPGVQQKISELQGLINSAGSTTPNPNDSQSSEDVQQSTVAPVVDEAMAANTSGGDDLSVIAKLNDWLGSIQARRNRV
ncbi:MAG: hypothetical protein C0623_00820 [Desulfuromonas sp.]|nr:MAG: hypothetical protein C0623_00820 [Desulfuromonas sp.]